MLEFEFLNKPITHGSEIKIKYVVYPVLLLFLFAFSSCTFHKAFKRVEINQRTVGVVVAKPFYFGDGGLTGAVMLPGAHWTWKSNEINIVSTQPFQVDEKFDDMYSSDNIPVDFDAFLNGQITSPYDYVKSWGENWYRDNLQQVFRTAIREECKRYKMTDLISNPDTPLKIETKALAEVQAFAKAKGIPFKFTGVTVGKINANKAVADEIAATAVQQQRQRTELDKKKAEDNRKQTEISRAAADNAYREAMNLQPEQYIRLEAVKAFSHAAEVCAANPNCNMFLQQPGTDGAHVTTVAPHHGK